MKSICDALKSLINLKQCKDKNSIDYLKRFKAARDVFHSHAGKDFSFPRVVEDGDDYKKAMKTLIDPATSPAEKAAAKNEVSKVQRHVTNRFLAYLYLENTDRPRYGSILSGLESQFSLNNDQYPKSLLDAQTVVEGHTYDPEYKKRKKQREEQHQSNRENNQENRDHDRESPPLSFAQMCNTCYCCGKNHKLPDCPDRHSMPKDKWHINKVKEAKQYQNMVQEIEKTMNEDIRSTTASDNASVGTSSLTMSTNTREKKWHFFSFSQQDLQEQEDMENTMILDSGSSIDLFCNASWLQDIKVSRESIDLSTNAGPLHVNKLGTLPAYGEVPFNRNAVTNIMSLAQAADKYKVTYDSSIDDAFYVHTPEKTVRFARNKSNLYVHKPKSLAADDKAQEAKETQLHSHLQTVEENLKFYTPREVQHAKAARELLSILGSPTVRDLKAAIAMNAIAELPIKTQDVDLAEKIFGPDLGNLKGKTARQTPPPMVTDQIEIPEELYMKRSDLELCIDIMYVNEAPYFTTISKALYYRTAQFLPTRTHRDLYTSLDEVLQVYNTEGFAITKIYCSNEFKPIMDPVKDDLDVDMQYSPPQGHVPKAERNNRTIKERIRSTHHRLPYKALPKQLMKILVQDSAQKLNYFPNKHGLSPYYSP